MSDNDLIRRGDAPAEVAAAMWARSHNEFQRRLKNIPAAPTFTAADLERAWEIGRDAGAERAAGRWATRSEHASRLFEMDYPEAEIDSKCYSHRADEADAIADEVRALTPPADLAQRVKGPAHD